MNVQMCAESCRGLTNRFGIEGGDTCYCLEDNVDFDKITTPSKHMATCGLNNCTIRSLGNDMDCGKWGLKYLALFHNRLLASWNPKRAHFHSRTTYILRKGIVCLYDARRHNPRCWEKTLYVCIMQPNNPSMWTFFPVFLSRRQYEYTIHRWAWGFDWFLAHT